MQNETIDQLAQSKALELEESSSHIPRGKIAFLISAIAIAMSLFQFYTAGFGILEPMKQRNLHITFALLLVFLLYPANKKKANQAIPWYDYFLALLSIIPSLHLFIDYERIVYRIPFFSNITVIDYVTSIIFILLILEATRRVIGNTLVYVAVIAILYGFVGKYLPGQFAHTGLTLKDFIDQQVLTLGGIYNTPIAVSSTYVFIFILFGAFLLQTGGGQVVVDIANAIAGHSKGGPAKMAVISSALFGTINGSSVANVVTTGTYTIPLMKKMGYKPHFAAAVEAVASTGGQLMPPIMGAAAFLMAEVTSIPYVEIIKAAILPAILYYVALFVMVHLEAKKLNLQTFEKQDISVAGRIIKDGAILFIPAILLLYLLMTGSSPMKAGFYATVAIIVAGIIRKKDRLSFKGFLGGFESGAKSAVGTIVTCATAGIIIGIVVQLSIGTRFASSIMSLSGGITIMALFMVMLLTIILGMGVPTSAAYVIAASVAVPSLLELGIERLPAHLFALYFACLASITPPVAVASYAAAGLANCDPNRTGWTAVRLGIAGFIVPYIFVFNSPLLLQGNPVEVIVAVITSLIGISALSIGVQGWLYRSLNIFMRLLLIIGGMGMVIPGIISDLVGIGILIVTIIYLRKSINKEDNSITSHSIE